MIHNLNVLRKYTAILDQAEEDEAESLAEQYQNISSAFGKFLSSLLTFGLIQISDDNDIVRLL